MLKIVCCTSLLLSLPRWLRKFVRRPYPSLVFRFPNARSVDQQRVSRAAGPQSPLALTDGTVVGSPTKKPLPFSLSREGRITVLKHLKCVSSPLCRLRCVAVLVPRLLQGRTTPPSIPFSSLLHWCCCCRYLDNIEITCAEIVEAVYGPEESEQKEDFRAQLVVVRALDGKDPVDCLTMDLSQQSLTRLNRHMIMQLARLQSLDLSGNLLTDHDIQISGIDSLPLVQLNLSKNNVRARVLHVSSLLSRTRFPNRLRRSGK